MTWDGLAISPQNSFRENQAYEIYDQIATGATGGRQRGHIFADGYFGLRIMTHHIGGENPLAETRRVAINMWLREMRYLGSYSDVPLVLSKHPTFPAAMGHAVVASSALNAEGKRVTTLASNRADIERGMYLSFVDGDKKRLFYVREKPADNQMVLFPSLTLESGDTLGRAVDIRVQMTAENPPDLYSANRNRIVYPQFNLIEVV